MISSEPDFPPCHSRLTWFQLSTLYAFCSLSHSLFAFTYSSSNSALKGKQNGERRRNIPSTTSFLCHGAMHCAFPMPACIFCHQPFLVVQDLKRAGRSYTVNQQALFFIAFLRSHFLYAFNLDCLNGTLSYVSTQKC